MSVVVPGAAVGRAVSRAREGRATLAALLLGGLAATGVGQAQSRPSFDCARAQTTVERALCAAPRLARLDARLGRDYSRALATLAPGERACLMQDQRAWRQQRDTCDSDACLEQAYLRRLQALQALLPGSATDRGPEAPAQADDGRLLAILPAADARDPPADELQDVILEGTPLEDEGGYLLVDGAFDLAAWHAYLDLQGDLEAIRDRYGDGPIHFPGIVGGFAAATLDDRARAAIEAVAAAGERLRVVGRAAYTDAAPPLIDSGHCAFVYALPPR